MDGENGATVSFHYVVQVTSSRAEILRTVSDDLWLLLLL